MINTSIFNKLDGLSFQGAKIPLINSGISTDSRTLQEEKIFVALSGENFNGLNYTEQVLQKGALIIVYTNSVENREKVESLTKQFPATCFIGVKDTVEFLQQTAHEHAKEWMQKKPKERLIIGITGSNGKTTHKEMLFHFLENVAGSRVICTEKNFNNHLGVPQTLFRLNDSVDYLILEMGTNHPGEIKTLCDVARPNAGFITNIGDAHLEFFLSRDNVFLEKRTLFDSVMKNTNNEGLFILNADDEHLNKLPRYTNVVSVGKSNADALIEFEKAMIRVRFQNKTYELYNEELTGEHNFRNLAVTFMMALKLFPDKVETLVKAAQSYRSKNNRSLWMDYKGKKIFLDAYNANPSSMEASLLGFYNYIKGNKIPLEKVAFIVGDMNELGAEAQRLHKKIGSTLDNMSASNVAFIGRYRDFYREGFSSDKICIMCANKEDFLSQSHWETLLNTCDYFFIKASRSVQLESLIK